MCIADPEAPAAASSGREAGTAPRRAAERKRTGCMPREAAQSPGPALPGLCLTSDRAGVPRRLRHTRALHARGQGRVTGWKRSRTPGSKALKAHGAMT